MDSTPQTTKTLPYAHKGDLTTGSINGHLVRMTIPMTWGMMAIIAVQLTDIYFISLLGDTTILAGISFTFPVTMLLSHLIFGINIALSSVVSRLIGARQLDDTRRVVLHGILMALAASAMISLLTHSLLEPLFRLLGADDATYPVIAQYMPLWLLASVVLALPVNANSAMRAAGDTLVPALIMICIALVNFALNPVLIFGWFGLEPMGVRGAAMATLLAYCGGAVLAMVVLIRYKKLIAVDGLHRDRFKDSMRRLLVIAIPAGLGQTIMPAATAIIAALLSQHGTAAVAAFGIVTRVEAFAMLFVISLAVGMAPIIGQNWGAGHTARARETIRSAMLFNMIWSAIMALVLAVAAAPLAGLFSSDAEVIRLAVLFFWIVPITCGLGNLVFGWSTAFNAMGKPQWAFVMILARAFGLLVPAAVIGGMFYGAAGIFGAIALVNILSGLGLHVLSRRYFEKAATARML